MCARGGACGRVSVGGTSTMRGKQELHTTRVHVPISLYTGWAHQCGSVFHSASTKRSRLFMSDTGRKTQVTQRQDNTKSQMNIHRLALISSGTTRPHPPYLNVLYFIFGTTDTQLKFPSTIFMYVPCSFLW